SLGTERRSLERWQTAEYQLGGMQALRYGHYYDLLHRFAPDADQILLTDLRDVLFQADPFAAPLSGLEVFLEDSSMRVGEDTHNRRWIRNLYGEDVVKRIGGCVVSCSGTVI